MKNYSSVEEAINDFYKNNHINPDNYLSAENEAYLQEKEHDAYIGKDIFSSRVNEWLQTFSIQDINIFLNLLGKYTYLTRREYRHKISTLSEDISQKLQNIGIPFSETVFITIPSPQGIKSGGDEIRSYINTVNICRDINNNQIVCSEELISPDVFKNKKALIFIDDIIGSGKTTISSIHHIWDYFKKININIYSFQLFYAGIYTNQSACSFIENHFNKLNLNIKPIYCKW